MREPGFYWVKCGKNWEVAEWTGHSWYITGWDQLVNDSISQVFETKLNPPEDDPIRT